jgi:acetyltransferase-like isoleucine patch superfamily enzyme
MLDGVVGKDTFGFDRHVNQNFYSSRDWRRARNYVITRDLGCDLGIPGFEIFKDLFVHHMNPISLNDIVHGEYWIIDPEFLITTSRQTHLAIHYGDSEGIPRGPIVRTSGDTTLW